MVDRMVTAEAHRHRGLGSFMMRTLADEALARGIWAFSSRRTPVVRCTGPGMHVYRVDRASGPVQVSAGAEFVEDQAVEPGPHPAFVHSAGGRRTGRLPQFFRHQSHDLSADMLVPDARVTGSAPTWA